MPARLLWLLAPLTLLGGIALGLYLAWGPMAGSPVGESPADLRRGEKEQYIRLVASAYAEEQDVRRARERLDELEAGNYALWVADLALAEARAGQSANAVRLARLAHALDVRDPQVLALLEAPAGGAVGWRVAEQGTLRCEESAEGSTPLLIIRVLGPTGAPVAGVRVEFRPPTGDALALTTDATGLATHALTQAGTLHLPDGLTLPVTPDGLAADCARAGPTAPHAFRVTLQQP